MAFKLKIKRGTAAPSNTALDIGELGFDTVGKKVYVGNGSGVAASGVSMDGHAHAASDVTSGEFDIARMPTITTGKGGTNITTYTTGDILYASNTNVLSKLGIGSTNQVLTVVAGVPAWAAIGTASQVANSLTIKFDTGTTEGTDLYTFNGSAAKTLDIKAGNAITIGKASNTLTINHTDTSSQASITASGRTYITGVTLDTYGHVTALATGTETVVDTNTTYGISGETGTGGANLRLTGSDASTDNVLFANGTDITVTRTDANTLTISHNDTSSITGQQGTAGVSSVTIDGNGHVTAVGTATYLTAEADTLDTVTGRGATTSNNITVGDIAVNGGDITTNQTIFNIGNTATSAQTINLGTAATADTVTKTINIGTGGASGSTTNITIGSATAGALGTLTLNSPTVVIPGNLTVTGTVTTNNVETVSTTNGVVFEGSAADNNELTLIAGVLTGDRTITLPDATGTVALTSDLHTRSHTMTSTSDHTAGNWKVFHSNGSGQVVELALSTAGHYLRAGGAAAAPTFAQIAYSEISGTPTIPTVNDGTHTIAGTSNVITVSTTGGAFTANKSSTTTDTLTLAAAFGDTVNPYASKTANNVLAAPNGSNGVPTFRALALADLPGISLDNLSDVIITSPATDSLLQYNGTNWIDVQELDCGTYTS
jgi:hypothetical protein